MIYQHYFFYIDPGEYKKMNNYQEDQECRSRLPKTQFSSKMKFKKLKSKKKILSDIIQIMLSCKIINCQRIIFNIWQPWQAMI